MKQITGKVAFVSFGEVNSPQELIRQMALNAYEEIRSFQPDTVFIPTITDDPEGADVKKALSALEKEPYDVLIICIAGWIPSHAVVAITDLYRHVPMVLWGLAGEINDHRIVTTAAQAGTTALRKVFEDLGYTFRYVYNVIGKKSPLEKIRHFIRASLVAKHLRSTKVGMLGFRDMRLYNTLYEGLSLKRVLGTEVDYFEMIEMIEIATKAEQEQIDAVLNKIKREWDFEGNMDEGPLKTGISYYLALKEIAQRNCLDAISLKDVDGMKKILKCPPAMIFMLLADEMNLCTIPENDAMGAVTQLVVKGLTGQCAAYLEFYEFLEESVLMGVPDYVPAEVVEGRIKVVPAAFGQISAGLLNVSTMKTGRITLARLSNTGERYAMHVVTGMAQLRHWEEAGWAYPAPQLPSLEVKLDVPIERFAEQVSGQHYIIAYGDHTAVIKDFCFLKNIEVIG